MEGQVSKKKGPFDATIKELEENVFAVTNFLQGCDENNHFPEFIVSQKKRLLELQLAIRVLEAAGKVDKQECLTWIDEMSDVPVVITEMLGTNEWATTYNSRSISPKQEIRALLEALPEPEQKKE